MNTQNVETNEVTRNVESGTKNVREINSQRDDRFKFKDNYARGDKGEQYALDAWNETIITAVRTGLDAREYDRTELKQKGFTDLRLYIPRVQMGQMKSAEEQLLSDAWETYVDLLTTRATDSGVVSEDEINQAAEYIDHLEETRWIPIANVEVKSKGIKHAWGPERYNDYTENGLYPKQSDDKWIMGRCVNVDQYREYVETARDEEIPTLVQFVRYERISNGSDVKYGRELEQFVEDETKYNVMEDKFLTSFLVPVNPLDNLDLETIKEDEYVDHVRSKEHTGQGTHDLVILENTGLTIGLWLVNHIDSDKLVR